jgi:hypothetical protein
MMERLFANVELKADQKQADAKTEAHQKELRENTNGKRPTWKNGSRNTLRAA